MSNITFEIAGKQVTGLQAEAHFVEWALALKQEHNHMLIALCEDSNRSSSDAVTIFQTAAYQDFNEVAPTCQQLVKQAGITISRA